MPPQKPKRDRGVILTLHGWDKLQAAKSEAEFQENAKISVIEISPDLQINPLTQW